METLFLPPEASFFQKIEIVSTIPHFISKNIYLQYFAILLYNNIRVALQCLKTVIILKSLNEKKTFNQATRFLFEKVMKKWVSIISRSLHWGRGVARVGQWTAPQLKCCQ